MVRGEQLPDTIYNNENEPNKVALNGQIGHTSYLHLDNIIHERTRLAIISVLIMYKNLSFRQLKDLLGVSDGNLSVHARRLEQAGYLFCDKSFDGRVPRTEYSLTDAGRAALSDYVECMAPLLESIKRNVASSPS